jgi:CubicO group peptidase (beta-lactamase class C family)
MIEPIHADGEFSGAVVLGRDGQVVYARGFGFADVERRLAFTPDTANDGASLTKPVTAAAVLRLAEQGRIDLDAPVRRYVLEYPHAATTVRHLLSHSGGLPDYGEFQAMLDAGPANTADLLAELTRRGTPPAFAPGTAFAYCNLCYDTLALVVERVTGDGFDRHLKPWLLRPLGMADSFLRPARFADWPGARTRGYRGAAPGAELNDAIDNEAFSTSISARAT